MPVILEFVCLYLWTRSLPHPLRSSRICNLKLSLNAPSITPLKAINLSCLVLKFKLSFVSIFNLNIEQQTGSFVFPLKTNYSFYLSTNILLYLYCVCCCWKSPGCFGLGKKCGQSDLSHQLSSSHFTIL